VQTVAAGGKTEIKELSGCYRMLVATAIVPTLATDKNGAFDRASSMKLDMLCGSGIADMADDIAGWGYECPAARRARVATERQQATAAMQPTNQGSSDPIIRASGRQYPSPR